MPEPFALDAALNWIWQGCVIALAAAAALRLLRRSRARHRHVLCAAALIAVLALPVLPVLAGFGPPAADGLDTGAAEGAVVTLPRTWWTSPAVPMVAMAGWIAIFGVRLIGALVAVRRLRARCGPFPPDVEIRLARWMHLRGSGRRARLALAPGVRSAAVLGCGRPIIAIAPPLIARLTPQELDGVVVHEWAHVQRRDEVVALAQLAVRAAAGWHPAVWWLDRQMGIEREAACDEAVIELTGSRKRYAASLVTVASLGPDLQRNLPLVAVLAPSRLEARLHRVLSHQRLAPRGLSAGTAAAGLLLLAALSLAIAPVALVETAVETSPAAAPAGSAARSARESRAVTQAPTAPAGRPLAAVPAPEPAKHLAPTRGRRVPPARPALTRRAAVDQLLDAPPGRLPSAAAGSGAAEPAGLPAIGSPVLLAVHAVPPGPPTAPAPPGLPGPAFRASPWHGAAGAGSAIGRGSKRAAETTSGVFTRFGKTLAASF